MKATKLLLLISPLFLAAGCVESRRYPVYTYTPAYTPAPGAVRLPPSAAVEVPPSPASDLPAVRVYPESPAPAVVVNPPGVSTSDLAIADNIRQVLKAQGVYSGVEKNIEVTVDNGVVTLRGVVPSQTDRQNLQNRIAALPGVQEINNQLSIQLR